MLKPISKSVLVCFEGTGDLYPERMKKINFLNLIKDMLYTSFVVFLRQHGYDIYEDCRLEEGSSWC